MDLNDKIHEWKLLKQSKKTIEKRISALRKDILHELGPEPGKKAYGLEVQLRDLTTFQEDMVYNIMQARSIATPLFTRLVIDESKVEELYLTGKITDDDLREIRAPRYVYALIESDTENV